MGRFSWGLRFRFVFFDKFSMMGSVWCLVFWFSLDGYGSGIFNFNFCGNNGFLLLLLFEMVVVITVILFGLVLNGSRKI